jgi:hypothetical protein
MRSLILYVILAAALFALVGGSIDAIVWGT